MRSTLLLLAALLVSSLLAAPARAQYTFFEPEGSFAIEVSLENAPYLRLPAHRNALTSLEVVGDQIVAGTSADTGLSPFLIVASLSERRLTQTLDVAEVVPAQRAIQSGFSRSPDGTLYAGTLPGEENASGHLLRINVSPDTMEVMDLGTPVPGEGVFALASRPVQNVLYGLSASGLLFAYHLDTGRTRTYEAIAPDPETLDYYHQYALEPADFLSRRLAVDRQGRIYGSQPVNTLFRFDPSTEQFEELGALPTVWGRRALGRADAWAFSADGVLFGGNAGDGQLFKIDPATRAVRNLGKPIMMPRLKALVFAGDGLLYGVAGAAPGYAHLFSYDPATSSFADLGNPQFEMVAPGIEQGIAWRGFQLATMAVSDDGQYVVMGEDEALSQLMVFPVE